MGNETKEEERTASDRAREADERFVQRLREALGDFLDTSVLGHFGLKTFRELCAILANGGDYDVAGYGTGNIYTENVEIGLVQVLRICENILTA